MAGNNSTNRTTITKVKGIAKLFENLSASAMNCSNSSDLVEETDSDTVEKTDHDMIRKLDREITSNPEKGREMSIFSDSASLEDGISTSTDEKEDEVTKFPISVGIPNLPDDNDLDAAEEEEKKQDENENQVNGLDTRQKRMLMPLMYQMNQSKSEGVRGTVIGPSSEDFHPEKSSEKLRQALNGLGTNEEVIIEITVNHNNFQRQRIMNTYENMYSRKLTDDLEEELGGFFLDTMLSLFIPAHVYSANLLHQSLCNRKSDHIVAVEIACTQTTMQMKAIKNAYEAAFRVDLKQDVKTKVEGMFGKMLLLLLCSPRDEHVREPDKELVEKHAGIIRMASGGIEEASHNVALFKQIFIGHSWTHIAAVIDNLDTHRKNNSRSIQCQIMRNKHIHSDTRNMLLTIVKVSQNAQLYFAEKLHDALSGVYPDHATIIRIVVSRSEIDLFDICEEYKRRYQRRLIFDIQKTCSGEYYRLLFALLSPTSNL